MNITFFTHPEFFGSQSMPRFAKLLTIGMGNRGHTVEVLSPLPYFTNLSTNPTVKKWFGYLDQYILFPIQVRGRIKQCPENTLFVFTDHALGPWVTLVKNKPNVIHCHDFLALRSAIGEIPENKTSVTGKIYQKFILNGFSKGQNFISVSEKTRETLHRFLPNLNTNSEMVYNGLSRKFKPKNPIHSRKFLGKKFNLDLEKGFILHIGGNQFYKNRLGVIEIYNTWRANSNLELPLLLIGKNPSSNLLDLQSKSRFDKDIHFLCNLEDELVQLAYCGATVFLFPSLAEGFGWPIVEAMASGCPVITTQEAPMTEVAGNAAFFIPKRPFDNLDAIEWASKSANLLDQVVNLTPEDRNSFIGKGLKNAKRFDEEITLDKIEALYLNILSNRK